MCSCWNQQTFVVLNKYAMQEDTHYIFPRWVMNFRKETNFELSQRQYTPLVLEMLL